MAVISQVELPDGATYDLKDEISGYTSVVELTQAEYDALTPAEKNNGTIYLITDGINSGIDASDIRAEDMSGGASDVQTELTANAVETSKMAVLVLTSVDFSSLPITITDSEITTDMIVINSILSNPNAQIGDWTVNTNTAGQAVISGSISGTTNITLYLMRSR